MKRFVSDMHNQYQIVNFKNANVLNLQSFIHYYLSEDLTIYFPGICFDLGGGREHHHIQFLPYCTDWNTTLNLIVYSLASIISTGWYL